MNVEDFKRYIKVNRKNNLIFDFDETIAKIELNWDEWHSGVVKIYKKYEPSFKYNGGYVHSMVNTFVKKYGNLIRDEIVSFNYEFEKNNSKGLILNDGLVDFIKNEKRANMYILTNNDSRNVVKYLSDTDLNDKFDMIIGRNDVRYAKPDIEGLNMIIKGGESLDTFLMIGDTIESDKAVADMVGIDFYLIDYFNKIEETNK